MEFMNNSISILKDSNIFNNIMEYQEFFLIKINQIYKIVIGRTNKEILIKCNNYYVKFNSSDFCLLTNISFESESKTYEYIINNFEENKIYIKDIIINKEMILCIQDKDFEIVLNYKRDITNIFINEINMLKNDISILKDENNKLKYEINNLKKFHYNTNAEDVKLLSCVVDDSFAFDNSDNSFTVFKSINDILYLVYSNERKSIICYDLELQKKIREIKSNHENDITNLRHYLDEIYKRDLVISISCNCNDNLLKVWDANDWKCLVTLNNANDKGFLYSAYLLKDHNNNYIITSNCNWKQKSEPLKIFNFNREFIKKINDSNENTFFIDTYYDNKTSNVYILTGNKNYVKSYDYNNNKLYHKYYDINNNNSHLSIIIKDTEEVVKLIESCNDGNIRIWNFHTSILLNIINIGNTFLRGLCLWDKSNLFVGCCDNTIKLIDLNKGIIKKVLTDHNNYVLTIKKIIHPRYGHCLVSQGYKSDKINLWINNN